MSTIKTGTECFAIDNARACLAGKSVFAFAATAVTAVIAAHHVGAVGCADILTDPCGAEWFVVGTVAAASAAAVIAAFQAVAIRFAGLFFANTFVAEETGLAFAAVTIVGGSGGTALDAVANEVAFDGAGAILAEAIRAFAAAATATILAALQAVAFRDADNAAPVFADVTDAAITAAATATVGAAGHAITRRDAFALAVGRTRFAFATSATKPAAAVVAAFFAQACRVAGLVAQGRFSLLHDIVSIAGTGAASSRQTEESDGRNCHYHESLEHS